MGQHPQQQQILQDCAGQEQERRKDRRGEEQRNHVKRRGEATKSRGEHSRSFRETDELSSSWRCSRDSRQRKEDKSATGGAAQQL
ncbi:hypothetical protein OJAV_G00181560 [Oryzias javanicus]|uniref:Uncharacterized protein n=1 Tax=Oryzias javanicus TaxID=123683 RepID=A0A437CCK4_ORYJA|nr:hypothetical protein OJAV_G00181560 [Oryzias javanicus]